MDGDTRSNPTTPRRFVIVLEAASDPRAVEARLKAFLKWALRRFGLRCVSAVEQHPDEPAAPTPNPATERTLR